MNKLIMKPWTHLMCIGFGALLAMIYHEILAFRKIDNELIKFRDYPYIYKMHKSKYLGTILVSICLFAVFVNLVLPWRNQADPLLASDFQNRIYYAVSRVSWVFGVFCMMVAILTGQFSIGAIFLSGTNMRFMAKCIIVCCVIQILIIEMLFQNQDDAMYLTISICF